MLGFKGPRLQVESVAAAKRELTPLLELIDPDPASGQVFLNLAGGVVVENVEHLFVALQPLTEERCQRNAVLFLRGKEAAQMVSGLELP